MLTTLLSTDPRTPADTLIWLAQRPRLRSADAVLLLTHPNMPDGAPTPDTDLHAEDVHHALINPATTTAQRRRLLSHASHETTWANMSTYADLTTQEIRSAAPHRGTVTTRYGTVLRNPATPVDVATAVLTSLLTLTPTSNENTPLMLATVCLERGLDPVVLTAPGMPTHEIVDTYIDARTSTPDLAWHRYLLDEAGLTNQQRATLGDVTTDPHFARDLTASSRMAAGTVLGNLRLDEATHLDAILRLRDAQTPEGERFLRHASDADALTVFDAFADQDRTELITTIMSNPHRDAATIEHIRAADREHDEFRMTARTDETALALAPATTAEYRDELLSADPAPVAGARMVRSVAAQLALAGLIHAYPHTGVLRMALPDLRRAAHFPAAHLVNHHLLEAVTRMPLTMTPGRAAVLLELESTFSGTMLELLELSSAIST